MNAPHTASFFSSNAYFSLQGKASKTQIINVSRQFSLYPLKEENAKWTNRCRMTREGDDLTWLPPLSPRLCWEESNTSSLRLHPKVNRLLLMLPNPAGWQKMGFLKQMCNYQEKRKRETLYTSEMEFLKIKRMKTCTQTRESGSRLWNRTLFKKRQAGTLCPESTKY